MAIGVSIIGVLLGFGDLGRIVHFVTAFHPVTLVPIALAILGYEAVRFVQWLYLLRKLGISLPLRSVLFAYSIGETTKYSPVGNYVPNYILHRSRQADFGLSSAATTYIPVMEVAVCLVVVVVVGVGAWTPFVRPLIIVGLAVFGVLLWLLHRFHVHPRAPRWVQQRQTLIEEVRHFRQGAAGLLNPAVLTITALLTLVYLGLAGAAFYQVIISLGVHGFAYEEALAAFCFALGFSLIVPLPTDLGSIEVSGTGALIALGMPKHEAVGVMLVNRVITLGLALLIAAIVAAILRGELRRAL
jgi:uncharacterized membrane protein YbhN (UPF0104 family)